MFVKKIPTTTCGMGSIVTKKRMDERVRRIQSQKKKYVNFKSPKELRRSVCKVLFTRLMRLIANDHRARWRRGCMTLSRHPDLPRRSRHDGAAIAPYFLGLNYPPSQNYQGNREIVTGPSSRIQTCMGTRDRVT